MMKIHPTFLIALTLGTALAGVPASAQVRVIVDGKVQEVPDGVIRTIAYEPGGRQVIRDERFAGQAAPGCATVTTTETRDEDDHGRVIRTSVVTRIEPIVAVAYAPPSAPAQAFAPAAPQSFAASAPPFAPGAQRAFAPAVYTAPQQQAFAPPSAHLDVDPNAFGANPAALADALPADPNPQSVRIRRDAATGHFITTIRVNGVPVRAIVDTGAQSTILSAQDARATGAGNAIVRTQPMAGIGGYTLLNVARLNSFEVGGQQLGGFTAAIGQEGIPYTLLGQTEIARLGRIVIEDGTMTITPRAPRMAMR
jgi:clan AA aspartic protease (TIGR02281 family)